ncbi:MAG: hypothetical protein E7617_02295 [Ruminococcaceae bacterium]|nr:hypothetical protein [Oscillospiraceae bacterium]
MFKRSVKDFKMTAGDFSNLECTLPATMYSVLIDKNYISDPLRGTESQRSRDSMPTCCVFSADVDLAEAETTAKNVYLRISGVYARAEIVFNGRSYGTVENPDRVYMYDIADRAEVGENRIEIRCLGAPASRMPVDSSGNPVLEYADAPDLHDMGIIGDCSIISSRGAVINDLRITQNHSEGRAELSIEIDAIGDMEDTRAAATLVSPSGKIHFGNVASEGKPITVSVPDPELWWPNGLGKPFLYKLSVTLYHGDEEGDTYERLVGLRSIELTKSDAGVYSLKVNGLRIFSRGATYVKENAIIPHVTRAGTESLIKKATAANMNTLRLFGDSSCVPDFFYELCDRNGLLIWQNIPVSYVSANAAGAFAGGITDSVKDRMAIAASHPSVALMYLSICATEDDDLLSSEGSVAEFREVCMRILDPVISTNACGIPFVSNPEELEACDEKRINADTAPDIPTMPGDRTIASIFGGDDTNILSPAAMLHLGPHKDFTAMLSSLQKRYRFPYGIGDLCYVSGLTAAKDIAESVKRVRVTHMGCTSAVLRQLNDSWPAISPSFIDFYGHEKAVCYLAKDFYAPVTVYLHVEGGVVGASVSNDTRRDYKGKLTLSVYNTSDKCVYESSRDVELGPASAEGIILEDLSDEIKEHSDSLYIRYELYDVNGINSHGTGLFVIPSRFAYLPSIIDADIEKEGDSFILKMTSDTYVSDVYIGFDGVSAVAEKNYVSLSPTHPVITGIVCDPAQDVEELKEALIIISPFDIGR